MDLKVVWSPEAIEDVESIAEYIGRDSEFYAGAVATKIIHGWDGSCRNWKKRRSGSDSSTAIALSTKCRRLGFSLWR